MVLRSVPSHIDSGDWLQGCGMQDPVFRVPTEELLSCPRPLMDRRLKPSADQLALRCPRCDSSNTKFCYYNNYSLSQPRYFCKTCRRYWTKGGSLRNVPVGGGCRKNKRFKRTPDQPSQTDPSVTSTPNNTNDITSCSPPLPSLENLNLPAVPSVYFTLLNGGVDGLGIGFSDSSHNHFRVAAIDGDVVPPNPCNNILEISGTATASQQPLATLSNLNTYQSLKGSLIGPGGPDQSPFNGDLTTIFDAHPHHHQQASTSSPPAISHSDNNNSCYVQNRFTDVTLLRHNNNNNNDGTFGDANVQWQNLENGQGLLQFDHKDNSAVEDLKSHNDIRLREVLINGIKSSLGGGEVCGEISRPAISSYGWQLPSTEGILLDSSNSSHYWNGATTWPDLSCYAPYTNALI